MFAPAPSTTRPPPGRASSAPAGSKRATQGQELLGLPVGPVARVLLGACRPGSPLEPTEEREGWALYHLDDQSGTSVEVALRTSDHPDFGDEDAMAAAFLGRARSNPKALGELQALLAWVLERDGQEGQWWWGDVARIVYGPAAKSHHNDHVRLAAALLCRGQWPRFADSTPPGPSASPWGGSPLLRFAGQERCEASEARRCRCPRTAHLNPVFSRALAAQRHRVPPEQLRLPQEGHTNPGGRRPSRAALLRIRTVALQDWLAGEGDPVASQRAGARVRTVTFQELLSRAGIDVNAHIRRRHMGDLLSDVVAQLKATATWIGVGLREAPVRGRRLLATVFHLSGPKAAPSQVPGAPQRHPSTPPAPTTSVGVGGRLPPRAPPPPSP